MLASAVVLPEDPPPPSNSPPPSTSLKRRQSSVSSDSSKRPRLDSFTTANGHGPPTAPAISPLPARRQSSFTSNPTEERKRNQRLFGALLGTLSQSQSSKPAPHRRRDEIEQRQREKLRSQNEEVEAKRRREREEVIRVRRQEQEVWDTEGMHLRHANMRNCARFLQTKTAPHLYYKPWDLRPEEDKTIKKQTEEIEETIRSELAAHATKKGEETGMDVELHPPVKHEGGNPPAANGDGEQKAVLDVDMEDKPTLELREGDGEHQNEEDNAENGPTNGEGTPDVSDRKESIETVEQHKEHDEHSHEELVEGEDDVIY